MSSISSSKALICPKGFFLGVDKETNSRILIAKNCRTDNETHILEELKLVSRLEDHENILIFNKWFCQDANIYQYTATIMDLGNVECFLYDSQPTGLPEEVMRIVLSAILRALVHIHSKGIIHRAIRGRNIFLNSDGNIRLSGFQNAISMSECSRWIGVTDKIHHFDESLSDLIIWLAPEVLKQDINGYGISSDVYSVGIFLCEMGNGFPPFQEMDSLKILFEKLRGSTPYLLDSANSEVQKDPFSTDIQEIVRKCLCYNPDERPSSEMLLSDHELYFSKPFSESLEKAISL